MSIRLFTYDDVISTHCLPHEEGLPWEDRWSQLDFAAGLCQAEQVFKSKSAPPPEATTATERAAALAAAESVAALDPEAWLAIDVIGIGLEQLHADPKNFLRNLPSVYNKLADLQLKREMATKAVNPLMLTDAQLHELSTDTVKQAFLRILESYIPEDRREEAKRELLGHI